MIILNLNLKKILKINMKTFDKSRINNPRFKENINNISNNQTPIFYRKTSSQKNKTSFYVNKKDINKPNALAHNKIISGTKNKIRMRNYTIEDTYPSTKMKSINYSRDKSSIECDDITPEKFNIYKTSVSPFCLKSNNIEHNENNNEKNIYKTYNTKNRNNNNKIKSFTLDSFKMKNRSLTNLNINSKVNENNQKEFNLINNENNNLFLDFKNRNNKIYQNFGKKGINFTFKDNNDRSSSDLLNIDINKNLQKNFFDKENNSSIVNSNDNLLLKNYITIDTEYTKNKINNKSKMSNNKIIYIKNKESKFKKNKTERNNNNNKTNLNKGKIIKFKYNGTEFFFRPSNNNSKSNINNTTRNELKIKSSKIIQKWWKKTILIKVMIFAHKFKFFINTIKNAIIRHYFLLIKYQILSINKIIFIQRKWREMLVKKKENISSIYIKNDTYGCDNSNKKIFCDNFYINTPELVNTIEDNNLKTINNNITNNKDNSTIKDIFIEQSYKKKLFHPIKNKIIINKRILNNKCFYLKDIYKNILDKIIFIQRRIKLFLKHKYSSNIRKIYEELFKNKIFINKLNLLNTLKNERINNFSINGKMKKFENFQTPKNNLIIVNKEYQFKSKSFNISKIGNFIYKGITKEKKYNLSIEKVDITLIASKPVLKTLQISQNFFQINNIIKKFDDSKMSIKNENVLIPKKSDKSKNYVYIDKNKIFFSINNKKMINQLEKIKTENKKENFKPPLINNLCLIEKIKLNNNKILNDISHIQKYYRNYIAQRQIKINKTVLKSENSITKKYKDNSLNSKKILKLQTTLRSYLSKKKSFYSKPVNIPIYITKKNIKKYKPYGFENFKTNNKLNIITNEINEKDKSFFNNINELLLDSNERNSTYINEAEESRNQIPIKVMQTKLYKNSINYNMDNSNKNIKSKKNKYINIESLPSYNSVRTYSDINEINSCDRNLINLNKKKFISIQTLESKESENKNKFKVNYINVNSNKRVPTEGIYFKNNSLGYVTENDNKYFYTENDIVRFSFSNGDLNFLSNSILRTTTRNFFYFKEYINRHIIKIVNLKLKFLIHHINLFIFIHMMVQRIQKKIHKIVYNKIFKKKNNINIYSIIKRHIKIYNEIIKDKKSNFIQNDIVNLLKNNIFKKYLLFKNKSKFLYITNEQMENLIKTNLFVNNDKDLINYYFLYYKLEYKFLDDKKYYNLIQFRLIKDPLYNMNIFAITKYMEELYHMIVHDNICIKCFCKFGEDCSTNCNCHIKISNSLNLINKIKDKINHNKSFNIGNSINQKNSEFLENINIPKDKRNIKIVIKKVKRCSADIIRCSYNKFEEKEESCNNSDIDIFQEMNTGIKSIINKVKINKAFRQFNHNKNRSNIIKIGRTFTEFSDNSNFFKKKSDNFLISNNDYLKYNTLFNNYNHFKNIRNETPEKKIYSFHTKKNIFKEK